MTKKEEFLKEYQDAKEKGEVIAVWLYIHMPSGETEVIINPNAEEKVAYIEKTYNDDLVHCNSDQIYIDTYEFGLAEDSDCMNFGDALDILKMGGKVARKGWNGKGMYLRYVDPYTDKTYKVTECEPIDGTLLPYIAMKTADNGFVPWLASQTDMLSEDWVALDDVEEN